MNKRFAADSDSIVLILPCLPLLPFNSQRRKTNPEEAQTSRMTENPCRLFKGFLNRQSVKLTLNLFNRNCNNNRSEWARVKWVGVGCVVDTCGEQY